MSDELKNQQEIEEHITREVQRQVARKMRKSSDEILELRSIVADCQTKLIQQHGSITRLTAEALTFGTLVKVHNFPEAGRFKTNDEVVVIDPTSPHANKGGRIVSGLNGVPVLDDDGRAVVKLSDDTEVTFSVGLEDKSPAQVRLTDKRDGTFAVVNVDGKPWEVAGVLGMDLTPGQQVKIRPDNKAIVSRGYDLKSGPICHVAAVTDLGVEVDHKGERQLVFNPKNFVLEEGDRVACDPGMFCVIEKLKRDSRERYKISADAAVSWDSVGGLETAKQEIRDALELPFQRPDLFEHYKLPPMRGLLLYGPPGCGKTLLCRAMATAMATLHGKGSGDTGYIYVKSPEILDKWIGNSEREIRELFERARLHYRQQGYKAILAFDEADAIMPQRGTRTTSSIADTMVPMFLGEMDGVDTKQTAENPIVVLMTNRADMLDPAVTRPGRISRHIKVERPSEMTAIDILSIHTRGVPFQDDKNRMAVLAVTSSDLFSKGRLIYRVNNEHDFTLGDCVNGAMLEAVADRAKMHALHRDIDEKTKTGVTVEDLRRAVQKTFTEQRGLNHSYDIIDFCERLGLQANSAKVERCFGAA